MAHADIEALFLKLPDDGAEGDHLQIGCFFIAERRMEVRVDAAKLQAVHVGIEVDELVQLAGEKAVAPHAGIDFDVRADALLALGGDAVENRCVVWT